METADASGVRHGPWVSLVLRKTEGNDDRVRCLSLIYGIRHAGSPKATHLTITTHGSTGAVANYHWK